MKNLGNLQELLIQVCTKVYECYCELSVRIPFLELESQIEQLRETQKKYLNILQLTKALTSHFYHVVQTQVSFKLLFLIYMQQ